MKKIPFFSVFPSSRSSVSPNGNGKTLCLRETNSTQFVLLLTLMVMQ